MSHLLVTYTFNFDSIRVGKNGVAFVLVSQEAALWWAFHMRHWYGVHFTCDTGIRITGTLAFIMTSFSTECRIEDFAFE